MMKKTNKLFLMMLVAGSFAMLFSSCNKDKTKKEVVINLPEFVEENDGKAYIDFANGNKFKWNGNDQVVIYNLAVDGNGSEKAVYGTDADAEGKTMANFDYVSGDQLSAKKYGYFAFYPVSKVDVTRWNQNAAMPNYQYFNVSNTQEYTRDMNGNPTVDPTSMAMAVELDNLDRGIDFKHVFGILRLKIKGEGNVTKIVVEDSRFNLNGSIAMKLHEVKMNRFSTAQDYFIASDDPYENATFVTYWNEYRQDLGYFTETPAEGGHLMTLICPSVALNRSTETLFYMGLRPGALKYGFKVHVYCDGATTPTYTLDRTGANNTHYGIKAGVIKGFTISF
jgi:hypothetical protein